MKNKILFKLIGLILIIPFIIKADPLPNNQINTSTTIKATTNVGSYNFGGGDDSTYKLISPIGSIEEVKDKTDSGFSNFVNGLIKILIALGGAITVVMIMVFGVQYMISGTSSGKSISKDRIVMALGGLILIFCSYLILNTINPDLVNIKIGGFAINESKWDDSPILLSDGTYSAPPKNSNSKGCAGATIDGKPITNSTVWPVYEQTKLIEALKPLNINVTSSGGKFCSKVGEKSCTAMYFSPKVEPIVKDRLIKLQKKAGSEIRVTGGSECWLHMTHGPEDAVVDLSASDAVNKAVTGSTSFPGGNKKFKIDGIGTFMAESAGGSRFNSGQHWHVWLE